MLVDLYKYLQTTLIRAKICLVLLGVFVFAQLVSAQPCTNYVFLQDFGRGSVAPLPTSQIPYRYVTDGCPNDGQYTIADSVSGLCYTSSWHGLPQDHTPGDVRGNMLVVNAPYPSEFFRQTVPNLCTQATYEFSFWMVNLNIEFPPGTCGFLIPNDPNFTIVIETLDGQFLDSLNTGTITRTDSPLWREFSLKFSIPAQIQDTTSVVIKLLDKNFGGCGNDFVIDDFGVKQCTDCKYTGIYIPDVFTPNGDGINDELDVYYGNLVAFEFLIYNRWGNLVFYTTDPTKKWDGMYLNKLCPEGVYAWRLNYEAATATSEPKKFVKSGQVMLLY